MLGQLRNPARAIAGNIVRTQGTGNVAWRLDNDRSVIDLEHTKNFPQNTEIEALLTFVSDQGQMGLNTPDPHALTVREHHSFVALPEPGFEPREQDIRVGFFGPNFEDFSQPFTQPLERGFIARWRLIKKDPKAAVSEPVKPITFYLDPGMPANIKAAAKRGILWWNDAFLAAGFSVLEEEIYALGPDGWRAAPDFDPTGVRYGDHASAVLCATLAPVSGTRRLARRARGAVARRGGGGTAPPTAQPPPGRAAG